MRPDRATLIAFFLAATLGSFNFISVRFSNRELAPFWGAGLRFSLACMLFFAIVFAQRTAIPRGRAIVGALLYGILGFGLSYALLYWAMQEVRAGTAAILMALVPLATFFVAVTQRVEPFRWRGVAGGLLAISGVALLQQGGAAGAPLGRTLAMLGAVLCVAQSSVVVKRFPRMDPFAMNGIATGVGGVFLLVLSKANGEFQAWPQRSDVQLAVAYLIVGGTVILFFLHIFVLQRWTASGTSYGFVITPLLSMPLAVWLDAQTLSPKFFVAALLVLAGVYVGALARGPASTPVKAALSAGGTPPRT